MSDFKVKGKLSLDGAGFFSTLNSARSAVNSFGGMLAGAFSVGAIAAFTKSVVDLAGELNDVSEALSINVEYLQKFLNSAMTSGGSLGDIEKFIFESNKARQSAVNNPGGKEMGAFSALGFSAQQVSQANPQQFMDQIIKAFARGATPQKINAISEIGGKSAKKLVGGFKDGLDEETKIINKDLIVQLDEIGDKFTRMANTIKAAFAPVLQYILDIAIASSKEVRRNQEYYGGIAGNLIAGNSWSEAVTDATKDLADLDKTIAGEDAVYEKYRAGKAAARSGSENARANFIPDAGFGKSGGESGYSDSLLSVGNFLGSGKASSLQSIAQRHLDIATEHLAVSRSILSAVGTNVGNLVVGI